VTFFSVTDYILKKIMEHRKTPKAKLTHKRGLFFNLGLIISLLLVITAFEWRTYQRGMVVIDRKTEDITELIEIRPTIQLPPKPPKVIQPILIEVPPDEIIEEIEYTFDADEIENIREIETIEIEPSEVVDKIFTIVEVMPEPFGGISEFFEFVYKEIKYPNTARRMGIDGRITIQFIIDKDGSLTNFRILRGIGAGCDEEVLRVLKMAPKWKPGKQRGIPVRVKMALPITFKLN